MKSIVSLFFTNLYAHRSYPGKRVKTPLCNPLLIAPLIISTTLLRGHAEVELLSVWQEYSSTSVCYAPPSQTFYRAGEGGVPGSRNFEFTAQGGSGEEFARAHSLARQSSKMLENGFQCDGSLIAERQGTGPYHMGTHAITGFRARVRVTGKDEAVTLSIRQHDFPNTGGIAFNIVTQGGLYGGLSRNQPLRVLPVGVYDLDQVITFSNNGSGALNPPSRITGNYDFDLTFTNFSIAPGALQSHPLMPDQQSIVIAPPPRLNPPPNSPPLPPLPPPLPSNQATFVSAPTNAWIDPPVAQGFHFEGVEGTTFQSIVSAPTGFDRPFHVIVDGDKIGEVSGGESFDFASELGHAVSAFQIRNIFPYADRSSAVAFPIMLRFTTETGSLTMTSINAPWADLTKMENGQMRLEWEGLLESSSDLKTWMPTEAASNPFVWTPEPGDASHFFRAFLPD